jgi:nucleotide-binding universal stress UspA family protein
MKILIGYDGSHHADMAIDDLRRAGLPQNAEARVLSAVEWQTVQAIRSWGMVETDFSPEWVDRIAGAQQLADTGSARLLKLFPQWTVQKEPSAGNPAEALLEQARTWRADLIVVGTHGRSALARALLGSVSHKLIREAPCSVRVARASHREGPIRVLIGTDGSPEADRVIDDVSRRSWPTGTEIRVLAAHAVLVPVNAEHIAMGENLYGGINQDEYLRLKRAVENAAKKLDQSGFISGAAVEEGNPKEVLPSHARDWSADMIFVGARGLGWVEGLLLGSVSAATVAHAPCSVEVVRMPS